MNQNRSSLQEITRGSFRELERIVSKHRGQLAIQEIGAVVQVSGGVAEVTGLTDARDHEIIRFPDGLLGIALDLSESRLGVVLLGKYDQLRTGDEARRTLEVVDIPVGEELLGRVIDAVGRPLDQKGPVHHSGRWPVERTAPAIIARAPVSEPLFTGIKAIDAAIPIGKGQRELILGDRQTGKTAIALSTIVHQRDKDVVCVYCSIGQRGSSVAKLIHELREKDAIGNSVIVVAGGDDPVGQQFIAPYAATTIAEYFMEQGRNALIVYDDLTRHARAYRELSLQLRRPPGREAFPGDIFFIHARLLERATHLREEQGGGSLTALPIIETQAQNIAAYIPTNLISITDGQIYLSPDLFQKGQLPAIDIGKSVSRVGGNAQWPVYRAIASDLRLTYSQFEELEIFARFGTRLDDATRQQLDRGRRVREILKQSQHDLLSAPEQVAVLFAVTNGLFDSLPREEVARGEAAVRRTVVGRMPEFCKRIETGLEMTERDREALSEAIKAALTE